MYTGREKKWEMSKKPSYDPARRGGGRCVSRCELEEEEEATERKGVHTSRVWTKMDSDRLLKFIGSPVEGIENPIC